MNLTYSKRLLCSVDVRTVSVTLETFTLTLTHRPVHAAEAIADALPLNHKRT